MRVWWVAAAGLAFVLGCSAGAATPLLPGRSKVEVEAWVYDFGDVAMGDRVRHTFVVDNRGALPLTLEPALAECGCLATLSSGGTLGAGETGRIEVDFDTRGVPGQRVRTVTIETNDPDRRELVLALRGNVVADVRARPERAFFGRVPRGATREIVVEIETADGVRVQKVKKSSRRFDVRWRRYAPPRTGIRMRITLRPQGRIGPFDDSITVTTSSERQPSFQLPVLGDVR